MKKLLLILFILTFSGCGKISPLSPDLRNKIDNQGQIEDIKNNQNGIMAELGKIRQQNETNARDIHGMNNSGIQFFSGDGGLVVFLCITVYGMFLIYHYRTRAIKSEKTSEILAQQVANYDDVELDDKIFLSAMNTPVEKDVYDLMVKAQSWVGKPRA